MAQRFHRRADHVQNSSRSAGLQLHSDPNPGERRRHGRFHYALYRHYYDYGAEYD